MPQDKLMRYDPATGAERPYPSHAQQWRDYHGSLTAWLFNPWSGLRRDARDVGSDTFGFAFDDTHYAPTTRAPAAPLPVPTMQPPPWVTASSAT